MFALCCSVILILTVHHSFASELVCVDRWPLCTLTTTPSPSSALFTAVSWLALYLSQWKCHCPNALGLLMWVHLHFFCFVCVQVQFRNIKRLKLEHCYLWLDKTLCMFLTNLLFASDKQMEKVILPENVEKVSHVTFLLSWSSQNGGQVLFDSDLIWVSHTHTDPIEFVRHSS